MKPWKTGKKIFWCQVLTNKCENFLNSIPSHKINVNNSWRKIQTLNLPIVFNTEKSTWNDPRLTVVITKIKSKENIFFNSAWDKDENEIGKIFKRKNDSFITNIQLDTTYWINYIFLLRIAYFIFSIPNVFSSFFFVLSFRDSWIYLRYFLFLNATVWFWKKHL